MKILQIPLRVKRYEFLYSHLDCDCIASYEKNSNEIEVIAFSETKEENARLKQYYYSNNLMGKYRILQGIDKREE